MCHERYSIRGYHVEIKKRGKNTIQKVTIKYPKKAKIRRWKYPYKSSKNSVLKGRKTPSKKQK